jgi:hypothetical protein
MKRKKQPTADVMREQLRLAADEIIRLRTKLADLTDDATVILYRRPTVYWLPWWKRLAFWR